LNILKKILIKEQEKRFLALQKILKGASGLIQNGSRFSKSKILNPGKKSKNHLLKIEIHKKEE